MKTLQQQEIQTVSGGTDVFVGDAVREAPTTDPIHPIDPMEIRKPRSVILDPTTDPICPIAIDLIS